MRSAFDDPCCTEDSRAFADLSELKQQIVDHVSYIRRYAHAVMGSQPIGDECICGCIETLVRHTGWIYAEKPASYAILRVDGLSGAAPGT
jgi:hypothetical protein